MISRELRLELLRLVLRPAIRFSLKSSVLISEFVEVSKQVFLDVAAEEIAKSSAQVSVSRLSVSTGIYRRDVTRIYVDKKPTNAESKSIIWRVIGQWSNDAEFTNSRGQARVLSFQSEGSDFNRLVEKISKAIGPAAVLFELERIQAVVRTPKGLKLKRQGQVIQNDPAGAFEVLSKDLDTLIRCVEINAGDDPAKQLHIRTEYDNIYRKQLPAIREWLRAEGKSFHRKIREYLSQHDADIAPVDTPSSEAGGRVVVSAFGLVD